MVIVMVTANSRNTRPTTPPISRTGMNTAIRAKVMEMMAKPISREPPQPGLERRHAAFYVPDDVFQHHDGVVDHKPDRQRQRQQRHVIDREAEPIHQRT